MAHSPQPPSPTTPTPPPSGKDPSVIIEDIFVFLSIPVLWLFVFRLRGPVCTLIGVATMAALLVILVRRVRRINAVADKRRPDDTSPKPPL